MFTVGHTSLFHLNRMNLLSVDVDQLLQIFQGWMKTVLSVKIDGVAVQQPSCRVGGGSWSFNLHTDGSAITVTTARGSTRLNKPKVYMYWNVAQPL